MTPAQRRSSALALAVALAAPAEGLRQWAYRDPAQGIPTICFGTTRGVKLGDFKSIPECKALLTGDMQSAVSTVEQCSKDLTVNQMAAFADLVYNVGPKPVCDTINSTLARKLQANDAIGACWELTKWDKARVGGVLVALPGLTKRRAAERELCLSP